MSALGCISLCGFLTGSNRLSVAPCPPVVQANGWSLTGFLCTCSMTGPKLTLQRICNMCHQVVAASDTTHTCGLVDMTTMSPDCGLILDVLNM